MSEQVETSEVRQTVRLPVDLHREIARFAAGNARRPSASFNSTLIFLLRTGLQALKEQEQGQYEAERIAA